MFSFIYSGENAVGAAKRLLQLLKVPVTAGSVEAALKEHPDYPSLLSMADALSSWQVETMGVRTTFEQLQQFPRPFLAHFKNNEMVPVLQVTEEEITCITASGRRRQYTKEDFTKQWDGIALLAAADESSGEPGYREKHRREQGQKLSVPLVFTGAVVLILLNARSGSRLLPALFSLAMLAGVAVTGLLLWYEIDKRNPVLHKICTAGRHTNCSAVLQSGAAKLWGIVSWSEIGFAYFTGGFLSLLLSGFDPAVTNVIAWLNLLAAPYILFSLYYQWRVAKQWCVLCLGVQALLLAGLLINLAGRAYSRLPDTVSVAGLTVLCFSFPLPLLSWSIVKPVILRAKAGRRHKQALVRLKHDPKIFEALLPKQKMITESTDGLGITLGNPKAKQKLIKVCNPYCGPCARAHPEIERILENNPDTSVQIIFTAKDEKKDIKSKPVKHLMAIAQKGDQDLTRRALDDWYLAPQKDYQAFSEKYPFNGELKCQGEKLQAMSNWCEKTGISFTPTFFVDGYQLPEMYNVEDLKYLLG